MNRRNYMGIIIGSLLSNNILQKYNQSNYPTLFNPNPVTIEYESNNKLLLYNYNKYKNKYNKILIVQNIYGQKQNVLNKKETNFSKNIQFKTKNTNSTYGYIIYGIKNNDYYYLGESPPYKIRNGIVKKNNYLLNKYLYDENLFGDFGGRQIVEDKKSYFDINYKYYTLNNYTLNNINYKINKQHFYSNKRYNLYHTAHDNAINSDYVHYLAEQFKKQSNYTRRIELINRIIRFVTSVYWVEDINSLNSYEYIRTPQHTCLSYIGDCKDTTILLNGLLSQLNIKTAILFSPGHMLTGIRLSDLKQSELSTLHNDYKSNIYESSTGDKYIPIETTSLSSIGNNNGKQIHTIYDGSYKIVNPNLYYEHAEEVLKYILS